MNDQELLNSYRPKANAEVQSSGMSKTAGDDDALLKAYRPASAPQGAIGPNGVPRIDVVPSRPVTPEAFDAIPEAPPEPPTVKRLYKKFVDANTVAATNTRAGTAKAFESGRELLGSGVSDLASLKVGPKIFGREPKDWEAGGVLKAAGGLLGMVASPLTGAVEGLVEKPLEGIAPGFDKKAGLVAGTLIPLQRGGAAAKAAMPTSKAENALVDIVGRENIPEVLGRMGSNPRLSVMDVSPNALHAGQNLSVIEGKNIDTMGKFTKDRQNSASGAVKDALDATLGNTVNPVEKLAELKAAARKVGTTEIAPAIVGSGPVNMSGVIQSIDDILKPGINKTLSVASGLPSGAIQQRLGEVRKLLTNDKEVLTDAARLHEVQKGLRVEAEALISSPNGADRLMGYELSRLRNRIVDAIDDASGKEYRPALAKYRDEKQVQAAFDRAQDIFKGGVENRPEFWAEWAKGLSDAEMKATREGIRLMVDTKIKQSRNARGLGGTEMTQVEFTPEKLSLFFEPKEVKKMVTKLRDERDIAATNQALTGGSQTAARMNVDSLIKHPEPSGGLLSSLVGPAAAEVALFAGTGMSGGGLGALALGSGQKLMDAAKFAASKRKSSALADIMTNNEKAVDILSKAQQNPKLSVGNQLRLLISNTP